VSTHWNPNQRRVIRELLGWDDDLRRVYSPPPLPRGLADRLREELEERLASVAEKFGDRPLVVWKGDLTNVLKCEGLFVAPSEFEWSSANVRGKVVHRAIQISVAGRGASMPPMELVGHAIEAYERGDDALASYLQETSPAELAEVVSSSSAAVTAFASDWPPLKPVMIPRIESRTKVPLCGGKIVLTGRYDLALGRPGRGSIIIDLKTGDERPEHPEEMRYYALLETLRHREPPYRVATYYLDGSWFRQPQDVDEGVLESAVRRTAAGVNRIAELWEGEREPALTPGNYCHYCPARAECAEGLRWLKRGRNRFGRKREVSSGGN
jgi:hypothetical protein